MNDYKNAGRDFFNTLLVSASGIAYIFAEIADSPLKYVCGIALFASICKKTWDKNDITSNEFHDLKVNPHLKMHENPDNLEKIII